MMKNKMFAMFVLSILAVSLIAPFALAQNDTNVTPVVIDDDVTDVIDTGDITDDDIVEAGVSPDSVLYGIDRALERISLALTFNKARRAEKALLHAEERLAEVRAMIEAKKLDRAEIAQADHDEIIEEVGDLIEDLESNGDEDTAEDALAQAIGLQIKLMTHSAKVAFVKDRILERQADRLSEEQLARLEAVFARIKDKAAEAELRAERKGDNIRIRHKVLAGLTDEESEAFEAEIRARIAEAIESDDFDITRIRIREKRNGDTDTRIRIVQETEDGLQETRIRIREKDGETRTIIRTRDVSDDDSDSNVSIDSDSDDDEDSDDDDDKGSDDDSDSNISDSNVTILDTN